jgi:hypothetical protein
VPKAALGIDRPVDRIDDNASGGIAERPLAELL